MLFKYTNCEKSLKLFKESLPFGWKHRIVHNPFRSFPAQKALGSGS